MLLIRCHRSFGKFAKSIMSDTTEEDPFYRERLYEHLLNYIASVITGPRVTQPVLFIDDTYYPWSLGDWYIIHTCLQRGPLCAIRSCKTPQARRSNNDHGYGVLFKPYGESQRRINHTSEMPGRFDDVFVCSRGADNPIANLKDRDGNFLVPNTLRIVASELRTDVRSRTAIQTLGEAVKASDRLPSPPYRHRASPELARPSPPSNCRRSSRLKAKGLEAPEFRAAEEETDEGKVFEYQIWCTATGERGVTEGIQVRLKPRGEGDPDWDDILSLLKDLLAHHAGSEKPLPMKHTRAQFGRLKSASP
jgi:hypothetical protein